MSLEVIMPGSTICILGAGQLAKMILIAAQQMGYHVMVWSPVDGPAMEMATHRLFRPFDDADALAFVCSHADVVTTEWENVPLSLIEQLEGRGMLTRPGSNVLAVAQKRSLEKRLSMLLGIPSTATLIIPKGEILERTDPELFLPGILKTDSLGYDGKGQWRVANEIDLLQALSQACKHRAIDLVLEKRVDLSMELSILVARNAAGDVSLSSIVQNVHKDGILDTTVWPPYDPPKGYQATINRIATHVADHLQLVGILCLEFFVDGAGNIYLNEIAPRPHNSFHGSIEMAQTSQFEQLVRAICGLPLRRVLFHTPFTMKNIIGNANDVFQTHPNAIVHLYGKEPRAGRKLGHFIYPGW